MDKILKLLALDHRSLEHQPLFWIAIMLPIILFFYFGWFSWKGHSLQWDSVGFSNFIEISKFPLTLLALTLPFIALVTSWHRSIQTAKQIQEAQIKNNSDRYYSFKKDFIDQVNPIMGLMYPNKLFRLIYPHLSSSSYDYSTNSDLSIKFLSTLEQIIETMPHLHDKACELRDLKIFHMECNQFGDLEPISDCRQKYNENLLTLGNSTQEILKELGIYSEIGSNVNPSQLFHDFIEIAYKLSDITNNKFLFNHRDKLDRAYQLTRYIAY